MIVPVILSGGSGTRLWPMSRELYPKQLLPLTSEHSLLQNTVQRLDNMAGPVVVCNEAHRFIVAAQLQDIAVKPQTIILEPVAKSTAPAVTIAALHLLKDDPLMLVLPADHVIQDVKKFHAAIEKATEYAEQNKLVTFGIVPTRVETGYGYIKADGAEIQAFVEKPNQETAEAYLQSGDYLWNSGMFLFRASAILSELRKHAPHIVSACEQALKHAKNDLDFLRLNEDDFSTSPAESIDYAVMEKTDNAAVVSLSAGWSDVGSWSALWELGERDQRGNVAHGDVVLKDVSNSYLRAENRALAVLGVDNCVVLETADAVLVADKNRSQEVKALVQQFKQANREETSTHLKVYRPWGSYEVLVETERFKVKRLVVNPGCCLSLQLHHKRSEHWIVVKGVADIIRGDENITLHADESTYIPVGTKHRISNSQSESLEIIEVQSGDYLGEDDIVRFEDSFGRN